MSSAVPLSHCLCSSGRHRLPEVQQHSLCTAKSRLRFNGELSVPLPSPPAPGSCLMAFGFHFFHCQLRFVSSFHVLGGDEGCKGRAAGSAGRKEGAHSPAGCMSPQGQPATPRPCAGFPGGEDITVTLSLPKCCRRSQKKGKNITLGMHGARLPLTGSHTSCGFTACSLPEE